MDSEFGFPPEILNKDNKDFYYDFEDGLGLVRAHYHPNGGGIVADTAMVDPSAFVDVTAKIYNNANVGKNCIIIGNSSVYDDAFLNTGVHIEDKVSVFGEAVLAPHVHLVGHFIVREHTYIGNNVYLVNTNSSPLVFCGDTDITLLEFLE